MRSGTPIYMPPEALKKGDYFNEKVDSWSLGCLLFNLLTGKSPFSAKNRD